MNNKICILINWPRELDWMSPLIKELKVQEVDIVFNDLEKRPQLDLKSLEGFLKNLPTIDAYDGEISFRLFSELYKKTKYKLVLSTGLGPLRIVTIRSLLLFIYSRTFSLLFRNSISRKVLGSRIANKLSSGGPYRELRDEKYCESSLGSQVVHFPGDLDLNLDGYPNKKWRKIFNRFMTICELDRSLINSRTISETFEVGYLRFDVEYKLDSLRSSLEKEFAIEFMDKRIIFWCPSYIKHSGSEEENIEIWLKYVGALVEDNIVILRPHPKTLTRNPDLRSRLSDLGFVVDFEPASDINRFYNIADVVVCDYGASIVTSVYKEKATLLLNLPNESGYVKHMALSNRLEEKIREELYSFTDPMSVDRFVTIFNEYVNDSDRLKKKSISLKRKYGLVNEVKNGAYQAARYLLTKASS